MAIYIKDADSIHTYIYTEHVYEGLTMHTGAEA